MKTQYNPNIPLDYILQEDYEIDENKEYTLQDLKPGMRVHSKQLFGVYNTWVLVANPVEVELDDGRAASVGTIVYIGPRNKQFENSYNRYTIGKIRPMVIYNVPDLISEDEVHTINTGD